MIICCLLLHIAGVYSFVHPIIFRSVRLRSVLFVFVRLSVSVSVCVFTSCVFHADHIVTYAPLHERTQVYSAKIGGWYEPHIHSVFQVQKRTALYCTVLHCTALYCTVLYSTVLLCTVLHCTVLHCTVLHCTVLHCTALHCTALYCTVKAVIRSLLICCVTCATCTFALLPLFFPSIFLSLPLPLLI
jgi:hypothetical protein